MPQVTYQIDPAHTSAHFSVRHMMISNVRGEFSKVSGTVIYDAANPANSKADAVIEVASISTREPQRDTHLKSADFFDAEKFPLIAFQGKEVTEQGGEWKLKGDLTIHGVTREISLDVEGPTPEHKDPWGNLRIGATATGKLNRKDYGLGWNAALEAGGVLVGDEVKLTIDLEAIRQ
jgi:polyisoprenoid-binding protein YceI